MSTIQIDVPESVLLSTGQSQEEFVREAKFLLALKLFELGRLSSGKAAEMCGMNRVDFILLAGRSGVPVADLDDSERETAAASAPSTESVHIGQKSYEMPPREGISIAHFLTVADIDRSLRFYETVFGGRALSEGDSKGAPGYIQIANTWLLVNVGGGPTPDKPTVTLGVLADPDKISSFMNIRVADIQACYKLWKSRGAEFITEPIPKYGETRCYIRDPDGYIIEVGQSTALKYG